MLLFYNNGCADTPQCVVILTLSALLILSLNFLSHENCIRLQLGILHTLKFILLYFIEKFQSAVLEVLSRSST